jgi:acetoacetate decarboxylase
MSFTRTLQEIMALKKETFEFSNAEMLTIVWETKPEIISRLLPEPLKPAKNPLALAFLANYPSTNFSEPYMESALFILADFNNEQGLFCLSMPVTDDTALIGGREYFGYPKKMALVSINKNVSESGGWTERHGIRFMQIKAAMTGKINHPDSMETILGLYKKKADAQALTIFNFKYFPSAELTGFDFNPKLIKEEVLFRHKTFEPCEGEIIFNKSECDPWYEVEVVKVLGAFYTIGDNTMLKGSYVSEADPLKFFPFAFMKIDVDRKDKI